MAQTSGQRRTAEAVRSFDPEALRRLRRGRGLSHDALGALVGVSRPNLIAYEKATMRPGLEVLAALAGALGVDALELTTATAETATLADLRARAGLSKSALAIRLGLARSTWDLIERGRRRLQPAIAAAAAAALGVSEEELAAARERGASGGR